MTNWRILIFVVFLVHFWVSTLIFFGIQPIWVGDDQFYHSNAIKIAREILRGNFSFDANDVELNSWYSILLGIWYFFGIPHPLWGGVLSAILSAVSAILLFALVQKLGGSNKFAFWTAFLGTIFYPSYVYFGSLTLRDTAIVPLVLGGFFLMIKFLQKPSLITFILLFLNTTLLFGIKAEISMLFMLSLLISAPFLRFRSRLVLAGVALVMFIVIPIFFGRGIFGYKWISHVMQLERIIEHREKYYSYTTQTSAVINVRYDSEKIISSNNLFGYAYSAISAMLGPFPWQMRRSAHWLALLETIPWYFVLYFFWKGFLHSIKSDRIALPFVLFAILLFSGIALISDNLGADMRWRMPGFFALFIVASIGYQKV